MSISPIRWRSATRPAIVAGAALLALAVTGATPALADQATTAQAATSSATVAAQATPVSSVVEGLQDDATGYCLDSNAAGRIYTNPCQVPGNHYQDWYITKWEFVTEFDVTYAYSIMDLQTGRCLDSNAAGQLYTTNPCQPPGNAYQMWALGGSGLVYIDTATGLVLDSNFAKSAYTHTPNGGLYQDWIPVS
jgi:hypothetical protein